jgi:hypothetical protein
MTEDAKKNGAELLADQPKPQEGPQVQARIVIELFADGHLAVNSNHLGNSMLMYGMLESAKDAIRNFQAEQHAPKIAIPKGTPGWWARQFGKAGPSLPKRR